MDFINWSVVGLVGGVISSRTVDRHGDSFPLNISLGIIGAVMGGFLFDLCGGSGAAAWSFWSMIVAMMSSRTLCC